MEGGGGFTVALVADVGFGCCAARRRPGSETGGDLEEWGRERQRQVNKKSKQKTLSK